LAIGGKADAKIAALCANLFLFVAKSVVAGDFQCSSERLIVVATVVDKADNGCIRKFIWSDEVFQPDLCRVHLQLGREQVHHTLDAVCYFRPPCASIGIGENAVGEDADDIHTDRLATINTEHHKDAEHKDHRCEQLMKRAEILDQFELDA